MRSLSSLSSSSNPPGRRTSAPQPGERVRRTSSAAPVSQHSLTLVVYNSNNFVIQSKARLTKRQGEGADGFMTNDAVLGQAGHGGSRAGRDVSGSSSDVGAPERYLRGTTRLSSAPSASVADLLFAGVALGALGDALLRASGPPGLNMSTWIAAVAVTALVLHRRTAHAL